MTRKTNGLALAVSMSILILLALVACTKSNKATEAITPVNRTLTLLEKKIEFEKAQNDITQKVKADFPSGITKIHQFESGVYLGMQKSFVEKKFILINGSKNYYPKFPPAIYRAVIKAFRAFSLWGVLHVFIQIDDCDYYIDIDEKTGEVIGTEKWCLEK